MQQDFAIVSECNIGFARTDATTASLLLTLEGVATALLVWFVFGNLKPLSQ